MGRTLGPFTDVSTARVDGAYEIYEGNDEEGRPVEILTLGAVSSKDPARRALLSDTVAWAHATRGPADAPILSADLNGELPYVVTLRRTGFRGVERLMERMLAMGPAAGPLHLHGGAHTGQIPVIQTDPHGLPMMSPPVGSPAVPASPGMPYLTRPATKRPGWLIPLIITLVLVVLIGGGAAVYLGVFDEAAGQNAPNMNPTTNEPVDSEPDPGSNPVIDTSLEAQFFPGTTATIEPEGAIIVREMGWPFAFRTPPTLTCNSSSGTTVSCASNNITVAIAIEDCPNKCSTGSRSEIRDEWFDQTNWVDPTFLDEDTSYTETTELEYTLKISRFFDPKQNSARHTSTVHLTVVAAAPNSANEDLHRIINEILTQTS